MAHFAADPDVRHSLPFLGKRDFWQRLLVVDVVLQPLMQLSQQLQYQHVHVLHEQIVLATWREGVPSLLEKELILPELLASIASAGDAVDMMLWKRQLLERIIESIGDRLEIQPLVKKRAAWLDWRWWSDSTVTDTAEVFCQVFVASQAAVGLFKTELAQLQKIVAISKPPGLLSFWYTVDMTPFPHVWQLAEYSLSLLGGSHSVERGLSKAKLPDTRNTTSIESVDAQVQCTST